MPSSLRRAQASWRRKRQGGVYIFIASVVILNLILIAESVRKYRIKSESWASTPSLVPTTSAEEGPFTNIRTSPPIPKLELLSSHEVWYNEARRCKDCDAFAASWWQTIDRFMELDPEEIQVVEDDVFKPILKAGRGFRDVTMTRDFMDFAVEHLSKWWKLGNEQIHWYAVDKLLSYAQRVIDDGPTNHVMNTTIALIPYGVTARQEAERILWAAALTATIASLLKNGIARIVVVGHFATDYLCTKYALNALHNFTGDHGEQWNPFALSNSTEEREFYKKSLSATISGTEIVFNYVEDVNSTFIRENVPKGAIKGIQLAYNGSSHNFSRQQWWGSDIRRYRYILLTEADQILHTRILDSQWTNVLDDGNIIIPHRLQPIPHADDFAGRFSDKKGYIPSDVSMGRVFNLSSDADSCCDTNQHVDESSVAGCGTFWWQCGFMGAHKGNFSYLQGYSLVRLLDGTGIVSLASNEHGRRCQPQHRRSCLE